MRPVLRFVDVLEEYMRRPDYPYTPGLLHRKSKVPKSTIVNWLEGRVEKPRHWEDLARVAFGLNLNMVEADRLLNAAGHPPITTLWANARDPKERALLIPWMEATSEVSAALPARTPRLNSLPALPTQLIGRRREVTALTSLLLRPDVRLLTICGPGGSGKTHLALHIANSMLDTFADGAAFIALGAVSDPQLMLIVIAQALGISDIGTQALFERLTTALRDKRLLLLLDTFEHILSAAPLVAELLAAASQLKILVTSRAVLSITGEHAFLVPPLTCVDPREVKPHELADCESVQLFVERSRAVRNDFQLTIANAPLIAEICYRLDGLPLAIELAAARSRVLTPQALLARIKGAMGQKLLDILTGGARNRPTYQQTLRGTIDWSYQLLTLGEQMLLVRLAVFVGGCTIEAAEAICDTPTKLPIDILDGLTSLVDKSLIQQSVLSNGEPRFDMLETIREYALERLMEQQERTHIQERYAHWVLDLVERVQAHLQTASESAWLDTLEQERANVNGAVAWALEQTDPTLGGRLSSALSEFCWIRGYVTLGRHWLRSSLSRSQYLPLSIQAKVLSRAGMLAWIQSDYPEAQAHCAIALGLYRELNDPSGIAWTLRHMAYVTWDQGDYEQTVALLNESLACTRTIGERSGSARALHLLGWIAVLHGNEPLATAYYQECLNLSRLAGDQQFVAHALNDLGLVWYRNGSYDQATMLIEEGLQLRRELRAKVGIGWSCLNLGLVARDRGEYPLAMTWFNEGLSMRCDVGDRRGIAECIEALASVLCLIGELSHAVRMYGFAAQLRELIGAALLPFNHVDYDKYVTQLHALLGADAYQVGWAAGQRLTLEKVLTYHVVPQPAINS